MKVEFSFLSLKEEGLLVILNKLPLEVLIVCSSLVVAQNNYHG